MAGRGVGNKRLSPFSARFVFHGNPVRYDTYRASSSFGSVVQKRSVIARNLIEDIRTVGVSRFVHVNPFTARKYKYNV